MKYRLLLLSALLTWSLSAQNMDGKILPKEIQIKTATLPAPEEDKEGAMVYGYDAEGNFVVLREGSNNLVCIADNPAKDT